MVKTYCVKQKKQTECIEPSGHKTSKMVDLCFGALALNVVLKNIDLLNPRETNTARTRCGRI